MQRLLEWKFPLIMFQNKKLKKITAFLIKFNTLNVIVTV